MSYTQLGNNDNPFVYASVPEDIKLPNGSIVNITTQTNHTAAKTSLSLYLDNFGDFVSGGTSPDFTINGHVVIGGTTYDGTLLQAQAQEFGYSSTITTADAEFDVRLTITGGLLTQSGGPYLVGDSLAVLLHQPGLTIGSFPQSFSVSNSLLGSSDTSHLPPQQFCLSTQVPETNLTRPPIPGADPGSPITNPASDPPGGCTTCGAGSMLAVPPTSPPGGCTTCGTSSTQAVSSTGNLSDTTSQDDGNGTIALYDGSVTMQDTYLAIPGRGINYDLTLTYRSDVVGTDECCGGWLMSYEQHLVVVQSNNLAEYQAAIPGATIGDVDQVDSNDRDDLYIQNGSSYIAPAGYYSQLVKNPDGSYSERYADGTIYNYGRPDAMGVATLKSESDASGDTMQFVYNDQEQLTTVYDTLGRPITYSYNTSGQLTQVQDYMGRTVTFGYDANGNLGSVTSPAVTGTPTGNNFANGVTTTYTYNAQHQMTSMTAPDEVMDGGPPRMTFTYDAQGRVTSMTEGGRTPPPCPPAARSPTPIRCSARPPARATPPRPRVRRPRWTATATRPSTNSTSTTTRSRSRRCSTAASTPASPPARPTPPASATTRTTASSSRPIPWAIPPPTRTTPAIPRGSLKATC